MSGLTLHFSVQSAGIEGWRGPHYGAADCSSGYYKSSSLAATDIFSPELTVLHGSGTERDGFKTLYFSCSAPVGQLWMLFHTSVLADLRLPRIFTFPTVTVIFSSIFLSVLYFSSMAIFSEIYYEINLTLWFCCFLRLSFSFVYLQWSDHRPFPYMTILKLKSQKNIFLTTRPPLCVC